MTWILQDQSRTIKGDSYDFLANLLLFVDGLDFEPPKAPRALLEQLSVGGRPPLYQLLTVPFVLLFGRSEDAALSINFVFLPILVISVYNIGRLACNARAGFLAALLVVCYPPIVHLSRTYMPHAAVPACVSLSLWILLSITKTRSARGAWLFGATLAFGSLIHPNFVYTMAAPTIAFGVYMLLFQVQPRRPRTFRHAPTWILAKIRDPFIIRGLLPAALIVLALVMPWYLTIGAKLFETLQGVLEFRGKIPQMAGFSDIKSPFLFYFQSAPGTISNILAVFIIASLVSAVIKRRASALVLVITLVAGYIVFNRRVVPRYWFYIAALLPVAASLTAVWIAGLRRKWLSNTLTCICVGVSIFAFSVVTWGVQPWSRPLAVALGSPLHDESTCGVRMATAFCPTPPEVDRWPIRDVLRVILNDAECGRNRPCRLMIVGDFWQTRFRHALIRDRAHGRLQARSLRSTRKHSSYDFARLLNSDYLIYSNPQMPPGRRYMTATAKFLQSPPTAFSMAHQVIADFKHPRGGARLIKRVKSLSANEAEASISAFELPEKDKSQAARVLSGLHISESRPEEARALRDQIPKRHARASSRRLLVDEHRALGRYAEVIPLLEEVLEVNPSDLSARIRLAEAYNKTGNIDMGIAVLEATIALAPPGNSRPHRALADVYRSLGKTDQAVGLYKETLKIDPNAHAVRVRLAAVYRKTGRVDAAISELQKAIALAPDNSFALRRLAAIYVSLGEKTEAVAIYEQILQSDPGDRAARKALGLLQDSAKE